MSYALSQDWFPDPADCVDVGGSWDARTNTCTLPSGEVVDVRQWCLEQGLHYDDQHDICFHPIDEAGCAERGGHWDGSLCHREPPSPVLTKASTKTMLVVAGVVFAGLTVLYLAR